MTTIKQTFTRHSDIQNWVSKNQGLPALMRVPDPSGRVKSGLALRFSGRRTPTSTPTQDDGMMPCSWTAWLAELDRQHLALRVSGKDEDFEFVERQDLN